MKSSKSSDKSLESSRTEAATKAAHDLACGCPRCRGARRRTGLPEPETYHVSKAARQRQAPSRELVAAPTTLPATPQDEPLAVRTSSSGAPVVEGPVTAPAPQVKLDEPSLSVGRANLQRAADQRAAETARIVESIKKAHPPTDRIGRLAPGEEAYCRLADAAWPEAFNHIASHGCPVCAKPVNPRLLPDANPGRGPRPAAGGV